MKLSEKLRIVAEWLESEENDLIVSADLGPRGRDVADVSQNPLLAMIKLLADALSAYCSKHPDDENAAKHLASLMDWTSWHPGTPPEYIQEEARTIGSLRPAGTDPAVNKAATDLWQAAENLKKQQAQVPAPKTASDEAVSQSPMRAALTRLSDALAVCKTPHKGLAFSTFVLSDDPTTEHLNAIQKTVREIAAQPCGRDPAVNKAATDVWQLAENLKKQQTQFPAPKTASDEDRVLSIVAEALVSAADIIRTASEYVASEEPAVELPSEGELDEIAAVAAAFDESEDEMLQKQAGILDNILAVLSSVDLASNVYDEDARLEEVKKKYHDVRDKLHEDGGLDAAAEAVEKSPVMKQKIQMQTYPLQTRYCPIHNGVSLVRIGEARYQCPMDRQIIDWRNGWTLPDGSKHPGGDVANQGDNFVHNEGHLVFQNRADRLGMPDK